MARTYRVISADGHLEVPPQAWTKYVPEQYRDRAPRLVNLPGGGQGVTAENKPVMDPGRLYAGKKHFQIRNVPYLDERGNPKPGTGSAAQRLREQDEDGVDAEVLYPSGFFHVIDGITHKPTYLAMIQAYNTFLAEYCSLAPDRLIGCALMPSSGIADAVAELRRARELGLRAMCPGVFPNGSGNPKPEDDAFWEASLSLKMPIAPHINIGPWQAPSIESVPLDKAHFATALCGRVDVRYLYGPAQMIVAGVFDRFPELEMYIAETYASWLPLYTYFMDENYALYTKSFNSTLAMKPSEYIRKHFYWGIIVDPTVMQMRDLLPADRLMWGSDFPHAVGSWPDSTKYLDGLFKDTPPSLRRKILIDNPAQFFGLDTERPLTPTPARG